MYASELEQVRYLDTGLFIDRATGGIPFGRITELWGDASVGKSTLALQIIASAQQQGLKCLYADVEYSYEPRYAANLGVINSELGIIQEPTAESVLEHIEEHLGGKASEVPVIVVLDSIGGLTPLKEIEKGTDGKVIGGQAGLVARFCRRIVPVLHQKNIALIVINHSFIDIMSGRLMTSGGKKLEYHKSLSIRLTVKPKMHLQQGGREIGKVVVATVYKDKVGGNEKAEADGHLLFKEGFSKQADILEEAIRKEILVRKGNTFWLGEEKLGMMGKLRERLKTDVEFADLLKSKL